MFNFSQRNCEITSLISVTAELFFDVSALEIKNTFFIIFLYSFSLWYLSILTNKEGLSVRGQMADFCLLLYQ